MESAGASRFITMDLYRKEIQGFFSVPVDNLRASPFLLAYIREHVSSCLTQSIAGNKLLITV